MKTKGKIAGRNGHFFNALKPEISTTTLDDLIYACSQICRFTGHTKRFYSVLEHQRRVFMLLKSEGASDGVLLRGLTHDLQEGVLSDINSPLKRLLPEYRVIEARAEIFVHSLIEKYVRGPIPLIRGEVVEARVREADLLLCAAEGKYLLGADIEEWDLRVDLDRMPDIDREERHGGADSERQEFMRILNWVLDRIDQQTK